ncbi:hypothetical protein N656DRAFT_147613 [Canariomyces notabilis]|uniref:Uncharacterized protein n=1 Tax=Canariomyces notabilis TaxID=2074819 RepID=A0AAN6TC90_9PEZI|nr:hypothetical protein N656DRAFT_147613 [Canariomyces arenarius]
MLVSGDFARRNNFTIHRGQRYQRSIELIDGSIIRTDGMVLNAEMEFDAPPMSSPRELDYDRYLEYANGLATLTSKGGGGRAAATKTTFVCDLHVIEDLPCDIILSSEFIFDNQVFSRFNHLFHSEASPAPACLLQDCDTPRKMSLNDCMLFMRMKLAKGSWFPWRRPGQRQELPVDDNSVILRQLDRRWEELWDAEELRRNQMQLWIATLPEPQKSNEQRAESQRQQDWDKSHPRPLPRTASSVPLSNSTLGRLG